MSGRETDKVETYEALKMEIITFDEEDIITDSNVLLEDLESPQVTLPSK